MVAFRARGLLNFYYNSICIKYINTYTFILRLWPMGEGVVFWKLILIESWWIHLDWLFSFSNRVRPFRLSCNQCDSIINPEKTPFSSISFTFGSLCIDRHSAIARVRFGYCLARCAASVLQMAMVRVRDAVGAANPAAYLSCTRTYAQWLRR